MSDVLLVITNMPDADAAQRMARQLIERNVAACVNQLAPCISTYRWQDKIETASEVPLLIKTTASAYACLEAAIRAAHPYELPEIIAVPVSAGLPAYLAWVNQETNVQSINHAMHASLSPTSPPPEGESDDVSLRESYANHYKE
jgi:periplasmic divalent cation tolerance protein